MSASAFPVTGVCAPIYAHGFADPLTVKNTGSSTAYLAAIDGISPASGFPVAPGSSQQWDAGRPLYAVANPGESTTLLVLENAGNLFDAGAIAAELVSSGLAVAIAQAQYTLGVPNVPRDVYPVPAAGGSPDCLVNPTTQVGITGASLTRDMLIEDTDGYQSLIVRGIVGGGGGTSDVLEITVLWTSGGLTINQDRVTVDTARYEAVFPVRGDSCTIRWTYGTVVGTSTRAVEVIGSGRVADACRVSSPDQAVGWSGGLGAKFVSAQDSYPATTRRLPVFSGWCTWNIIPGNIVTASWSFQLQDVLTNTPIVSQQFEAGAIARSASFLMPPRLCRLQSAVAGAPNPLVFVHSFTWQ